MPHAHTSPLPGFHLCCAPLQTFDGRLIWRGLFHKVPQPKQLPLLCACAMAEAQGSTPQLGEDAAAPSLKSPNHFVQTIITDDGHKYMGEVVILSMLSYHSPPPFPSFSINLKWCSYWASAIWLWCRGGGPPISSSWEGPSGPLGVNNGGLP